MTRAVLAGVLLTAAIGTAAQAPIRPSFAGEWTPDPSRSGVTGGPLRVSGPAPAPAPAPAAAAAASPTPSAGSAGTPRITEPRKIKDVPPVYPPNKMTAAESGIVILSATIDKTGHVVDLDIVRSTPGFEEAAIKAVSKWEYAPTLMNGEPIPVVMSVVVTFNIGRPGASPAAASGRGSGRGGPPPSIVIKQDDKELKITRQREGGSEAATYRFDGKDSKNRLSIGGAIDGNYTFVSQWQGDSLVTKITFRGPQGPRENTETISVDKDTLVIRTVRPSLVANGDPFVQTQTYVRKP
jgi:TonB family protein